MKHNILMAVLLSGLVVAAGAASANERGERPDFATLDLNGDGALTLEELQAQAEARFASIDTDSDGGLSAEELIAAAEGRAADRAAKMIERLDENGDGILQQDEMPRRGGDRADRMFERVDADEDGVISQEEFDSAKERANERRGERRGERRDRG